MACSPWCPRRLMFARHLGAVANVVRRCNRFDRKGCVSCMFWLARAVLAALCVLRCPRAALAGPPILVSCILCLCLPLASVLLRWRVCLCLACILCLCLCLLAPVLTLTTARLSVSGIAYLGHVFAVHARGHVQRYFSRPVKPLRSDTPSDPN